MNIIEVKDLKKAYLLPSDKTKTFNAVDSISLGIKKGGLWNSWSHIMGQVKDHNFGNVRRP